MSASKSVCMNQHLLNFAFGCNLKFKFKMPKPSLTKAGSSIHDSSITEAYTVENNARIALLCLTGGKETQN